MLSIISNNNQINQTEINNLILERKNLIAVFKLVIKDLIDTSVDHRTFETESNELKNFFDVLENIFYHGFKGKKGFSLTASKKDLYYLIELIISKCPESNDTFKSVKDMNDIKTSLGRLRAWLKLSLMQKKLADYFNSLVIQKNSLAELYEAEALLLSDESSVISGLLVGLSVLNFNLCLKLKSDDFDEPLHTINYSSYLRERIPSLCETNEIIDNNNKENINTSNDKLTNILDQNNYLEELNKRSKDLIEQLQLKLQNLEKKNTEVHNELTQTKNIYNETKKEIEQLKQEKQEIENEYKKKLDSTNQDIKVERETFQTSKAGLDNLYIVLQNKLQEEIKMRQDTEKELEEQISMKIELESAIKLLENSLVEKQDLLTRLREQLEQVKLINIQTVESFQNSQTILKAKTNELELAQTHITELNNKIKDLEIKINNLSGSKDHNEQMCAKLTEQLLLNDKKKNELEKDLTIEKTWRLQLQDDLNSEKQKNELITNENDTLTEIKKEYDRLKIEHQKLKLKVEEQEKTLEEMGTQLEYSRLKMEDFKEVNKQIHDFEWEKDDNVSTCKLCNKDFNVARRKHHCRRCGRIFCNECSDNKMPLPSSSKPVRVCDACRDTILQQCTVTN